MPEYDPRARLDDEKESWLAVCIYGGPFIARAAAEITRGLPYNPAVSFEIRYYLVYSALCRGDLNAARVFVNDWSKYRGKPTAVVHKWIPGDHYHALNQQFDTLDAAKAYIERSGYKYGGYEERHVYQRDGD